MSVDKKPAPSRRQQEEADGAGENGLGGAGAMVKEEAKGGGDGRKKEARYGRCFSGLELSVGPGPLREVDAGKLKDQIRRWARAVVAYARQLSFRGSSPRSSTAATSTARSPSSRRRATPRSATFPSKSVVLAGAAKDEPEPPP